MKKKILIFSLLIVSTLVGFGQNSLENVEIITGEKQEIEKRTIFEDIVGYDETGIYTYRKKVNIAGKIKNHYLEHYDQEMSRTKSVEFILEEKNKEMYFEFIVNLNNELYLFSSFANQKLKKNFLFYQSINKETLKPSKELIKIAEIDYSEKSIANSGLFDYEISYVDSNLLIYYSLPYDRGENEKFGFHVFDKNMNQLWHKRVDLTYTEELMDIEDYKIDSKGNVHLLGLIYDEKRTKEKKGNPNYKFHVFSFLNNGNQLKEHPLEIEGKFLTDMKIAINKDQDVICGGFYSSESTSSIEGSYFSRISSETNEIVAQSFEEFDSDFLTQYFSEKEKEKSLKKTSKGKDVSRLEYDLNNIVTRDDGGAILIAEQFYQFTTSYVTSDGGSRSTTTYNFNEIIIISKSSEGKIEWTKKIPKKQITVDDLGIYSSYALAVANNKMYFLFNDHPRNLSFNGEGEIQYMSILDQTNVVLVTVDSKGNDKKQLLYSTNLFSSEKNVLFRPFNSKKLAKNELVLFGHGIVLGSVFGMRVPKQELTIGFTKVRFLD